MIENRRFTIIENLKINGSVIYVTVPPRFCLLHQHRALPAGHIEVQNAANKIKPEKERKPDLSLPVVPHKAMAEVSKIGNL